MTSSTPGLHRLIYLSSAVGVLRADELDRILLRSKATNSGAGITGLLIFHDGSFLQMIEGAASGVTSLMQKIRRDRRHSGIIMLQSGPCAERIFPESPLHYVAPRNLSAGEKQAFSDLRHAVHARPMLGLPVPHSDIGLAALLDSFRIIRTA